MPLGGEQVGNQLSYRYWKRQEKLRLDVELAQRRANETRAGIRQPQAVGNSRAVSRRTTS